MIDRREIDLQVVPFEEGTYLIRHQSLRLSVTVVEDQGIYSVQFEDIDLFVWEDTVQELQSACEAQMCIAWKQYVMGDQTRMTAGARDLAEQIKGLWYLSESDYEAEAIRQGMTPAELHGLYDLWGDY